MAPAIYGQTKPPSSDTSPQASPAQTPLSPEDAANRKKFLALVAELPASTADFRYSCASGKEVGKVNDARASGDQIIPDASETCPFVIDHQVRDGAALEYYQKIVSDGGGNISAAEALKIPPTPLCITGP